MKPYQDLFKKGFFLTFLWIGSAVMAHASLDVEELITEAKKAHKKLNNSTSPDSGERSHEDLATLYCLKASNAFSHYYKAIQDGSPEEQLIKNWSDFVSFFKKMSRSHTIYKDALQHSQKTKLTELDTFFFDTNRISSFDQTYRESAEYILFTQVCLVSKKTPQALAEKYSISENVLEKYNQQHHKNSSDLAKITS